MSPKFLISAVVVATLTACATGPIYHPASKPGGEGFTEQQIQDNRFRVTFNGNASTARETVEDYLLYRAAELTVAKGYDYFIIAEKDTEAKKTVRTVRRPAYYGRYAHFLGESYYSFPYYAYGFDWTYPYEEDIQEYNRYSASAYIDMHRGVRPINNPRAFNAQSVLKNLEALICLDDVESCAASHSHKS